MKSSHEANKMYSGAFDLPPKPLQEEMITAYFDHVNPVAPVINKTEFMQAFYNNTASPLLLFAIFTAGCKACRNPILIDQSGTKFATGLKFWKATKVCCCPTTAQAACA